MTQVGVSLERLRLVDVVEIAAAWSSIVGLAVTGLNFAFLVNTRRVVDREVHTARFGMQKALAVSNCASAMSAMAQLRGAARRGEWLVLTERLPDIRTALIAVRVAIPTIQADVGKNVEQFLAQLTTLETQAEKAAAERTDVNGESIVRAIVKQGRRLSDIQAACESATLAQSSLRKSTKAVGMNRL